MKTLNNVDATVSIGGVIIDFVKLELTQEFNKHHKLEVTVDFDKLDFLWMSNLVSLINKIGETIIVTFTQEEPIIRKIAREVMTKTTVSQNGKEASEQAKKKTNIFGGIITNVSALGENGEQNFYVITAMSPTIKLDGYPGMDSFVNKTLKDIVDEVAINTGSGAIIKNEPKYAGVIDYFCQYNESAFQVLNRLSWLYNEWFYNDGTATYFGKPQEIEELALTYDLEITRFNLSANLVPAKFTQYYYLGHRPLEICQQAPDNLPEVRGFIQAALNRSNAVYTSNTFSPLEPNISDSGELVDLVEADKARAISDMLVFEGQSISCLVKIGTHLQVLLPSTMRVDKMVEKFLVTKVVHTIDQAGRYKNSFSGIPANMRSVPMQKPELPKVGPQIATVVSSVDEEGKGRIKVQFQWQNLVGKTTNWIRVQTPDAGASDKVSSNRGMVFIPEEGDQVMISFEYNDPSRPFVQGSMFPENHGTGGGKTNNSKSLTTRSGSTVSLDDDNGQGSVQIKDASGNSMDFDGTEIITITANNQITLTNGKCTIEMIDDKIRIYAPEEISIESKNIGILATDKLEVRSKTGDTKEITVKAQNKILVTSKNELGISASSKIAIGSKAISIVGKESVDIDSKEVNINS